MHEERASNKKVASSIKYWIKLLDLVIQETSDKLWDLFPAKFLLTPNSKH